MPFTASIDSKNYANYSYIVPYIRYCAEDRYQSAWELKRRKISDYEFIFVTEGTGTFTIENRIYDVKAHDLLLLKPNLYHSGNSVTLPFHFLCIHFDLYVSKAVPDLQMLQHHLYESIPSRPVKYYKAALDFPEYIRDNDSGYLQLQLRRIIKEVQRQPAGHHLIVKSIFTDLLINLFRQQDSMTEERKNSPEVQAAIDYIKQNYMKRIFLPDLAKHVHLQPTYLSSLFKKYTGFTITEFTKLHRISSAKSLLLETSRKVEDIACSVGFYDLHHFSRVFKEQEGLTPIQYRQIKR